MSNNTINNVIMVFGIDLALMGGIGLAYAVSHIAIRVLAVGTFVIGAFIVAVMVAEVMRWLRDTLGV